MVESPATGPLAGLRVIDCSTVLAGPYCAMLLGDLGADVVKIEPPDGDATRGWGPPWVGGTDSDGTRTAAYYLAVNRNKRGIRVDLRTDDGKEILRRLLLDADVLVENARVDGFARLGFDDATLTALNSGLVHLAITGYGLNGPAADRPGYDFVNQAQNAFATGVAPGRLGNAHPNIVPYETFETADGSVAVAVGSERQWLRFCAALGVPELAADPRFASNGDRVEHRDELRPLLA